MSIELIKLLIPVVRESVKMIKDYTDSDIDGMTLEEIRSMLEESENDWPELDFKYDK